MSQVKVEHIINGFTVGDYVEVEQDFDLPSFVSDNQETIATLILTVKLDPDTEDTNATFQKSITTTDSVNGIIDNDSGGVIYYTFRLASSDTSLFNYDMTYYYDVRAVTSASKSFVIKSGTIVARQRIGNGGVDAEITPLTEVQEVQKLVPSSLFTTELANQYLWKFKNCDREVRIYLAAARFFDIALGGVRITKKKIGKQEIDGVGENYQMRRDWLLQQANVLEGTIV